MTPKSAAEIEQKGQRLLELAGARASAQLASTDDDQLREPAARFLADRDRLVALSGREFVDAVRQAIHRFDDETEAAIERLLEPLILQLRESFETLCRDCEELLTTDDGSDATAPKAGPGREFSPLEQRIRKHAPAFLAEADRIRALTGEDFHREATAAIDAFVALTEMNGALKVARARSSLRRLRVKLVDYVSSSKTR